MSARGKERRHTRLLAETILALCNEKEFFIRKAIGWVLRDYSYADPAWVERFVEDHQERLSGLSRREAMKRIERTRGRKEESGAGSAGER